jgi:hypothetical protein
MSVEDGVPPSSDAGAGADVDKLHELGYAQDRKWFTGPKAQGDEQELNAIEAELRNFSRELEGID